MSDVAGVGPALSALIERLRKLPRYWMRIPNEAKSHAHVVCVVDVERALNQYEVDALAALSGSVGGLNAAPPAVKDCQWAIDDVGGDSVYETSCGHNFYFDDSTYAGENSFKFCAYCGGNLIEVKTSEALPASPVCAAEKKA